MSSFESLSSRTTGQSTGLSVDGLIPTLEIVASLQDAASLDGANNIDIAAGLAVVCGNLVDRVAVLDVRDPLSMSVLGFVTHATLDGPRAVKVAGGLAYVCSSLSDSITIIDYTTDPTAPVIIGSLVHTSMDGAHRICVAGSYAFVTAGQRLACIDISVPWLPRFVNMTDDVRIDDAFGVVVDGNIALVAGSAAHSIAAIDVSDPVASMPIRSAISDAVNLNFPHDIRRIGGAKAIMSLSGGDGIAAIDYSDPDDIARISTLSDTSMNGAHHLDPVGRKHMLVASQVGDGLALVNIEALDAMHVVDSINDSRLDETRGMRVVGRTAFLCSHGDARVVAIDLGAMSAPTIEAGQGQFDDVSTMRVTAMEVEAINGVMAGAPGVQSRGPLNGKSLTLAGLPGSVTPVRFVGGTASGPPTTGVHLAGDFVVTTSGNVWVCTVAGSPGTWAPVGAAGFKLKTVDEPISASTVLQNDDELFSALAANATYPFEALILYDGATTGDIRLAFTVPAGASVQWFAVGAQLAATSAISSAGNWSVSETSGGLLTYGAAGAAAKMGLLVKGLVRTAGTAGNLQAQWAQANSDVVATHVFAGSYLWPRRVA